MKVLVLNCGRSSVKFQLIESDEASAASGRDHALWRELVEGIGGAAILNYEAAGRGPRREIREVLDHEIAVDRCLALLTEPVTGALRDRSETGLPTS